MCVVELQIVCRPIYVASRGFAQNLYPSRPSEPDGGLLSPSVSTLPPNPDYATGNSNDLDLVTVINTIHSSPWASMLTFLADVSFMNSKQIKSPGYQSTTYLAVRLLQCCILVVAFCCGVIVVGICRRVAVI